MSRSITERIDIALKHVRLAGEHLERGELEDQLIFDAVCQRLSSAIEEISSLDPTLLDRAFGEDWKQIRAMRNVLVHDYEFASPKVVERTFESDIPKFTSSLQRLKAEIGAS